MRVDNNIPSQGGMFPGYSQGGMFPDPKPSDSPKSKEYDAESTGVKTSDLTKLAQLERDKQGGRIILGGMGGWALTSIILTLVLVPLIANPIVLPIIAVGGLISGGVFAALTFMSTAGKTNDVCSGIFKIINASKNEHTLDLKELKDAAQVLYENHDQDGIRKLFSKLSPKQVHALLVDNEVYAKYLTKNAGYAAISSGKPDKKLLDEDPYYRAMYDEWMTKEKKQIDEDIFAMDYPHITAKMTRTDDVSRPLNTRKIVLVDAENGQSRAVSWSRFSEYSKSNLQGIDPGKHIIVTNLQGMKKVFDILERKATISTREELEAVMQVAEEWEFNELIQDIDLMVQNRKDLIGNEQELANFVEAHPLIQRLRNAGIDLT